MKTNVKNEKSLKYYQKKLKDCDYITYKLMKNDMKDPLLLVNNVIRHYQWILLHGDLSNFNLQHPDIKIYQDLFIFGLTSSKEFADEIYNYFIYTVSLAYNNKNKRWNSSLLKELIVNSKRLYHFDVAAMYILIVTTIEEMQNYINNININEKINIPHGKVIELIEKISTQKFYDEIKKMILGKREFINEFRNY